MKLLTYNLKYGGQKKGINYWAKMIDIFSPDIIFAQESNNPYSYFPADTQLFTEHSTYWEATRNSWGSAIYVRDNLIEPINIPGFEGWVVGGRIKQSLMNKKELFIFSVHAPSPGPYPPKVYKILDEIKKIVKDNELIIAGDFNMTTALRHPSEELAKYTVESKFVTRMRKEFGLVNSWQSVNPNQSLPQTLRWDRDQVPPYHCDAIFIPCSLVRYIESSKIINTEPWINMSDHNPILLSIEF